MSERHPSDRPLIIARNVTFGYGSEKVLDGIDLEIRPRDFLAIIGPNGGGKTTLAKVLLGLLEPWSGEVIRNPPVRFGRMGYVPQFSTFDRDFPLRVSDVVLMGKLGSRSLFRPYSRADRADVGRVLERLGLTGLARVHVREISGGQLQRVLIARAIVSDPEILFLDEPTASIDAESREVLMTLLAELNQRIPVVVITHDITGLAPMVRRIACVNHRLVCHEGAELDPRALEEAYGGPVELVTHGAANPGHRVLHHHH